MTRVLYQLPFGLEVNHVIAPYGIVYNTGRWWLIGRIDGELRVLQVTNILRTELLPERFERPGDFSLEPFWETWASITADVKAGYAVKLRVSPPFLRHAPSTFGEQVRSAAEQAPPPDKEGWRHITYPLTASSMPGRRSWALEERLRYLSREPSGSA